MKTAIVATALGAASASVVAQYFQWKLSPHQGASSVSHLLTSVFGAACAVIATELMHQEPIKIEEQAPEPQYSTLTVDTETPSENAIRLLERLTQHHKRFSENEMWVLEYTLKALKLPPAANIPAVLSTEKMDGEIDEESASFLRSNFMERAHSAHPNAPSRTLRGVALTLQFAKRLQRESSHKHLPAVSISPYKVSEQEEKKIRNILLNIGKWDFDVFELKEATGNRELQTVGWHVLHQWGLVEKFHINQDRLREWLIFIESQYCDTQYHNSTHAADVTQLVHFFLLTCNVHKYISEFDILAMILACIIHDVGHDGFNNNFHQLIESERAIHFNNQSIQENYHASFVFERTLSDATINIFESFSKTQRLELRNQIVTIVLGTDMTKHFDHVKELKQANKTILEELQKTDPNVVRTTPDSWSKHVQTLIVNVVHAADISNPARPRKFAKAWAEMVLEEFFKQGDKEKSLQLPVSPQCDRDKTQLPQTQIGFIKFIVLPFYEALADVFPEIGTICLSCLRENLAFWQAQPQIC